MVKDEVRGRGNLHAPPRPPCLLWGEKRGITRAGAVLAPSSTWRMDGCHHLPTLKLVCPHHMGLVNDM